MGISSEPLTLKFWQSPHFQHCDFSPERRSKVVKFAKNDRLDALMVLARDEQFLFFPWKWCKGGTIGWFFFIFWLHKTLQFCYFYACIFPGLLWLGSFILIKQTYLYKQTHCGPVHVLHHPYQYLAQTQLVVVIVLINIFVVDDVFCLIYVLSLYLYSFLCVYQLFKYSISRVIYNSVQWFSAFL